MNVARALPLLLLALLILPSCGDEDPAGPPDGQFTVTFDGLPALGHGRYYEAWLTYPGEHLRHEERLSLGQFVMNGDGTSSSLDGGPAAFALDDTHHLADAVDILVTVESEGSTVAGPALIAGVVTGDENEGRATLTTLHPVAVGADLTTASGSFILATPTDGEGANETHGLWFTDPAGAPALNLPALASGWTYHAHAFHGGHSLSLGTFTVSDAVDSDGAGAEAGAQAAFTAPGSDFIVSEHDLADGATTAFLVIEPSGDHHEESLRHDSSFPVRVLEAAIPSGAAARTSIPLAAPVSELPSAEFVFTR